MVPRRRAFYCRHSSREREKERAESAGNNEATFTVVAACLLLPLPSTVPHHTDASTSMKKGAGERESHRKQQIMRETG